MHTRRRPGTLQRAFIISPRRLPFPQTNEAGSTQASTGATGLLLETSLQQHSHLASDGAEVVVVVV
jgi:hypothetical protein